MSYLVSGVAEVARLTPALMDAFDSLTFLTLLTIPDVF